MEIAKMLAGLVASGRVGLNSTDRLVGDVLKRIRELTGQQSADPDRPALPELFPAARQQQREHVRTSPWELLHALARASALSATPASHLVAQHWDCLRYLPSLESARERGIALTGEGNAPRFHQKAVQGQNLGVAFGLSAARTILQQQHPGYRFDAIDAVLALRAGWQLRGSKATGGRGKLLPQYFLVGRKPGAATLIASIDCKGSHSSKSNQVDQLAKATWRADSVVLGTSVDRDTAALGVLTTTAFGAKTGIETRVLSTGRDFAATELAPPPTDLGGRVEAKNLPKSIPWTDDAGRRRARPGFRLPHEDRTWFARVLARTCAGSLLAFAGDRDTAGKLLTEKQREVLGSDHSPTNPGMRLDTGIELGGCSFVGTDHVFRMDGKRVEVFSGLFEHLHGHLAAGRLDEHEAQLPGALDRWQRGREAAGREWGGPISVDADGSVLAIRVWTSGSASLR